MTDWQPTLYTRFEDERTRPARDLLARCDLSMGDLSTGHLSTGDGRGARIVDLGCGPGNSTGLLVERFAAAASITGIDSSSAMLAAARERLPTARFEAGDIAVWQPDAPVDLLFSNAALHWVPDHARLLPRLFAFVAPGGLFAAQIPDNLDEPAQVAMREIAAEPQFAPAFADVDPDAARTAIAPAEAFYDWLSPQAVHVEVWHTIYRHPMDSAQAITDWFTSTGLKPFLDALPHDGRAAFQARYTARMADLYPARADGKRLLAFPRLFLVARKAG